MNALRRELAWLCVPLLSLIAAGAWISARQTEALTEQHRRGSGPLLVRVWGIQSMPVVPEDRAAGYDYGYRVDAHIEGQDLNPLAPSEVWMMRLTSAQIGAGATAKKARVVHVMSPLVYTGKPVAPQADVMAVTAVSAKARELEMWVYCDTPLANPLLKIKLEAVAGKVVPVPGTLFKKKFVASGQRLAAATEEFSLQFWNASGANNAVKSDN